MTPWSSGTGLALLLVAALALAACAGDPEPAAVEPTPAQVPPAATPVPATPPPATPPPATATPRAPGSPTPVPPTSPPSPATPAAGSVLADARRCTSPDGFTIGYPADWAVVADCGMFGPAPLPTPEPGTDQSPGAVSAYVDPVPFGEVVDVDAEVVDRAVTVVDGRSAVRVLRREDGEGLYPAGTRQLLWVVDLDPGIDEGEGTLFVTSADAGVDVPFEVAVATADAMARSVDVTDDLDLAVDPAQVVARYQGGGAQVAVAAAPSASTPATCFRLVGTGDVEGGEGGDGPVCLDPPAQGAQEPVTAALPDPAGGALTVGLVPAEVARVEVAGQDLQPMAVLAVPVVGRDVRAFAVPVDPRSVTTVSTSPVMGPPLG